MQKDNRTHRLLGALIKRMEKNDYEPTYISLATDIHPWYKYLYCRFFNRTQNEVRALFERIGPNGDKVFMGVVQEFKPTRLSHEDLYRMRNHYSAGDYKEEIKPLELAGKTIAIIAPIIIATTATINMRDNQKLPILTDSLRKEQQRIKSLLERKDKDSIEIESMRDCLKKLKNDSSQLKNDLVPSPR